MNYTKQKLTYHAYFYEYLCITRIALTQMTNEIKEIDLDDKKKIHTMNLKNYIYRFSFNVLLK